MHHLAERIADRCLANQFITQDQTPWLIYALEKRMATIFVGIPFFLLGVFLSDLPCSISFFASFFFLRKYANGYHANSHWACLVISLVSEAAFFLLIYPALNGPVFFCLAGVSVAAIFLLAPYNHPHMHLTEEEAAACRSRSRIRAAVTAAGIAAADIWNLNPIAKGLILGMALAAVMLCLGYIFHRRNHHE